MIPLLSSMECLIHVVLTENKIFLELLFLENFVKYLSMRKVEHMNRYMEMK